MHPKNFPQHPRGVGAIAVKVPKEQGVLKVLDVEPGVKVASLEETDQVGDTTPSGCEEWKGPTQSVSHDEVDVVNVAAIEDSEYKGEKTSFWHNVYGVNMSCMTNGIFTDPMVDVVPSYNIMSDSCCILDLDLVNCKASDVEFSNCYSLKM